MGDSRNERWGARMTEIFPDIGSTRFIQSPLLRTYLRFKKHERSNRIIFYIVLKT